MDYNNSFKELKENLKADASIDNFKKTRMMSGKLLEANLMNINEYNSIFNTLTCKSITFKNEKFYDLNHGSDVTALAEIYSRAKHGSINDIKKLASDIYNLFVYQFEIKNNSLYDLFQNVNIDDDILVLLVPGSRNIESASNIIFDIALPKINVFLAKNNYPTIINVKLPRLDQPVENYASLSQEEREEISKVRDHILPDKNFYKNRNIHLFFGDDVLITGATADKVISSAIINNAKSYHAIYSVVIDPVIVGNFPEVENVLNTACLKGDLSDEFISSISGDGFIPVMKTFNVLLNENNINELKSKINTIPINNVEVLYVYAMSNGYNSKLNYKESLGIIEKFLEDNK